MVMLDISNDYGYVLLTAASTVFVNMWHATLTSKARKASGIGYPNAYATAEQARDSPAAYNLNCAQRAHANFTENLTPFMASLLISGTRYPVQSAVMGAGWLVSRIAYTAGYTSSNGPKGRLTGAIGHYLFGLSLALTACYTSVQMVRGA
ncbi:putative microsomal glutathione s-transferase [Diaporthe ampelina]|uniref:Putative microsomal glutathione s-transferase n=1 Tax=Diaporthe ampelina TaxID=1214573 RepID=A0A0G2HCT3_9PEZI|nr:putative microsomal glutathione s-transferase [Diaporthe ampelina]